MFSIIIVQWMSVLQCKTHVFLYDMDLTSDLYVAVLSWFILGGSRRLIKVKERELVESHFRLGSPGAVTASTHDLLLNIYRIEAWTYLAPPVIINRPPTTVKALFDIGICSRLHATSHS